MYAVKANRQYTVEKVQAAAYQAQGYDILDDGGKLLQHGAGKTFPATEYERVCRERDEAVERAETLAAELERLKKK